MRPGWSWRRPIPWCSLSGANLRGANLSDANLQGVNLSDANLQETILTGVKGLTQEQLDRACGDAETKLPHGLTVVTCPEEQGASEDG